MERTFASPDERLRSLIAREKQMPAALGCRPPESQEPAAHFHRDRARAIARDHQLFPVGRSPAFRASAGPSTQGRVFADERRRDRGPGELSGWLKNDVLPRSHGDFRIGADTYRRSCCMTRWWTRLYPGCCRSPMRTCIRIRRSSAGWPGKSIPRQPRQVLEELDPRPSCPRRSAAELSRYLPGPGSVHPGETHRRYPFAGATHRRRDAALHARDHRRLHGYTRARLKKSPKKPISM